MKEKDNYEVGFSTFDALKSSAKEQSQNDEWVLSPIRDMNVSELTSDSIPEVLPETEKISEFIGESRLQVSYAVEKRDLSETGLAFDPYKIMIRKILRPRAIKGILDRAKSYGSALAKIPTEQLASHLNNCFLVWGEDALILTRYGKVTAVHSGSGYSILLIPALLDALEANLLKQFPGFDFVSAHETHEYTGCSFQFPGQREEILKAYSDALRRAGKSPCRMVPGMSFFTSDTSDSAATVVATLTDTDGLKIRIGSPIRVEHKNGNTVEQFAESLDLAYAMIKDGAAALAEMLTVTIENPVTAVYAIAKSIGFPKKYLGDAMDTFVAFHGDGETCAHDLYMVFGEAIANARALGETEARILDLEETAARTLQLNWKFFDHVGA